MGILDAFTGTTDETLRRKARSLLFDIIEVEKKIENLDREIPRAASRGNDETALRAERVTLEIRKLDTERLLERIDAAIIREEQEKIARNAHGFPKRKAA